MASSLAKECLSPALKSSSMRRRSLDICQQLGSQLLLSPNFLQQISSSLSSPSSSKSASPNGSPFKLIPDSKNLLSSTSCIFTDDFNLISGAPSSPSTYHGKRRASDSFWMVESLQKKTSLFGNDSEKCQKRRRSITPQHPSSTTTGSENVAVIASGVEVTAETSEENKQDAMTAPAVQTPAQQQPFSCACYHDEEGVNSDNQTKSSVVTCNIIPPTPLKPVCKGNCKKEIEDMPPLRCSLAYDEEGTSEDDNFEEEHQGILEEDKKNLIRRRSCSFQLEKDFPPIKPFDQGRRCSAGAKYDLDENLIKLVASHWNLSLNPDELLGKGSFGTVIAGQYQGKQVAVKCLKTTNPQRKASILGEENALNLPFHNHIARTMDIFQLGPDRTLIIMEKHLGNLLTLLNDPDFEMSCSKAINISKQIALALMFCHRQGILHLDVKPQNVLVDFRNCCKLSDFGSSKKISDLDSSYKYCNLEGTVPYTAPELFKGDRPTQKCDVYSLGIMMWQIITGEVPYENENEHTVIFRVVSQGLRPGNNNDPSISSGDCDEKKLEMKYVQLYKQAWDSAPAMRPSMTDLHKSLLKIQFLQ